MKRVLHAPKDSLLPYFAPRKILSTLARRVTLNVMMDSLRVSPAHLQVIGSVKPVARVIRVGRNASDLSLHLYNIAMSVQ